MATEEHHTVGGVDSAELKRLTFDTRTELATIIGATEILCEDLSDKPFAIADLEGIRSSAQKIQELITRLEMHTNRAREAAVLDPLTGIANRRAFEARCQTLFETAGADVAMSLVLIDLDKFKNVNDTYGHLVGDEVLKGVVDRCRKAIRESDHLARLAGDEFVLLLPHTPPEEAMRVADRLRHSVVEHPIATGKGPLPVSVSVGVATWRIGDSLQDLVERADRAMYVSKHDGRNRITALAE